MLKKVINRLKGKIEHHKRLEYVSNPDIIDTFINNEFFERIVEIKANNIAKVYDLDILDYDDRTQIAKIIETDSTNAWLF